MDASRVHLVHGRRLGPVPAHGQVDGADRRGEGDGRHKSFEEAVTSPLKESDGTEAKIGSLKRSVDSTSKETFVVKNPQLKQLAIQRISVCSVAAQKKGLWQCEHWALAFLCDMVGEKGLSP